MLFAGLGIVVNGVSAFYFFKERKSDINIRGAYQHLLADALVSLGVVLAGLLILWTSWNWVDTIVSLCIGFIILLSTWKLLTQSIRLALDGIPDGIDLEEVKSVIMKFPQIALVHHIHIWALSSQQNALTAHLVIKDSDLSHFEPIKQELKSALEHLHISHVTFEPELIESEDHCNVDIPLESNSDSQSTQI